MAGTLLLTCTRSHAQTSAVAVAMDVALVALFLLPLVLELLIDLRPLFNGCLKKKHEKKGTRPTAAVPHSQTLSRASPRVMPAKLHAHATSTSSGAMPQTPSTDEEVRDAFELKP